MGTKNSTICHGILVEKSWIDAITGKLDQILRTLGFSVNHRILDLRQSPRPSGSSPVQARILKGIVRKIPFISNGKATGMNGIVFK